MLVLLVLKVLHVHETYATLWNQFEFVASGI